MYKNDEVYGDVVEFYDMAAGSQPAIAENILKKFADMAKKNAGIILDVGAGTGKTTIEIAKLLPDKEVIALEASKYMRIALMSRLAEHEAVRKQITVLPWTAEQYDFKEEISGILCMGVLGHLKKEQQNFWRKLGGLLKPGVPVLIELLNQRFLNVSKGSRISVATQGRLRYETYITDINHVSERKWEWLMEYKTLLEGKIINTIKSPMEWNYDRAEDVLNELIQASFRGVKLSDTLLLASKR